MDLSSPISSVIPSAHGAVLAVLGELADAGIVLREHRPPAKLYRLNRDHVAAAGITALPDERQTHRRLGISRRARSHLWTSGPTCPRCRTLIA